MKTTNMMLALMLLFILYHSGHAQTGQITREKWLQEMQYEEQKITEYVDEQMRNPVPEEVLRQLRNMEKYEQHLKGDKSAIKETVARDYYRKKYFQLHPQATKIYNPGRVSDNELRSLYKVSAATDTYSVQCNGNFEDGNLSPYLGFRSTYSSGVCNFVPTTNVAYTPTPLTGSPDNFLLTNNGADPLIASLNQTNGGSAHAIRINSYNPCPTPGAGINMLQRTSPPAPVNGRYRINFSYALVMEDAHGIGSGINPFFVARVLNSSGVEVGSRVCRVADLSNPFYEELATDTSGNCRTFYGVVWRDWTCASIEFDAIQGQQYTIEFFVADCGATGHFGYAYVDDICAEVCCPKFMVQNCCDLQGGGTPPRYNQDPAVKQVLSDYQAKMDKKYGAGAASKSCCDPCKYPNDPFPIFLIDEYGNMVSSADYTISWSHDPGNTSAWSYILPGQQTVVTVKGPGKCVWVDTFQLKCCDDTITIVPFCTWDPCKYPNSSFPLKVKDQLGTILTTGAGYTFSWIYNGGASTSTGDAIVAAPTQFPVYVTVTDPATNCVYRDTFDIDCCTPTTPTKPGCRGLLNGSFIYWDPVPNAAYYRVHIYKNDPACRCSQGLQQSMLINVYGTDTTILSTLAPCFSWQVAAVCPDGTTSPYTGAMCSCTVIPTCATPATLKCGLVAVPDPRRPNFFLLRRQLSWSPVSGASSYELEITYSDFGCCNTVISMWPTIIPVSGTSYLTPSLSSCFAWRVRTVCAGGLKSAWSAKQCSCKGAIFAKTTGDDDSGLEDLFGPNDQNLKVTAVPNPASDYVDFTVQFGNSEYQNLTLSIIDLSGREVSRKSIVNSDVPVRVDVRSYAPGMYIYVLRENDKMFYSSKIIIQK